MVVLPKTPLEGSRLRSQIDAFVIALDFIPMKAFAPPLFKESPNESCAHSIPLNESARPESPHGDTLVVFTIESFVCGVVVPMPTLPVVESTTSLLVPTVSPPAKVLVAVVLVATK